MSKFEAQISVSLNPASVSGLAKNIEESLSGKTITLSGLKVTAGSVDVSGISKLIKSQLEAELKDIGANIQIGVTPSVSTSVLSKSSKSGSSNVATSNAGTGRSVASAKKGSAKITGETSSSSSQIVHPVSQDQRRSSQLKTLRDQTNKILNDEKKSLRNELATLKETKKQFGDSKAGLSDGEIKKFEDLIQEQTDAVNQRANSIKEKTREIAEWDQELSTIMGRITTNKEQSKNVLENKKANKLVKNSRQSIRDQQDYINQLTKRRDEIDKELQSVNDDGLLDSYKSQIKTLSDQINERNNAYSEIKNESSKIGSKIGDLEKESADIQNILHSDEVYKKWKSDVSTQISGKNNELSRVREEASALKSDIDKWEAERAEIQDIIGSGSSTKGTKAYMKRSGELSAQIREGNQKLTDLLRNESNLESSVSQLETTRQDLDKQIKTNLGGKSLKYYKTRQKEIASQLSEENKNLSEMREKEVEHENQINDLTRERAKLQEQASSASNKQQNQALIEERARLNQQISNEKKTLADMKTKASEAKENNNIKGKAEDEQLFSTSATSKDGKQNNGTNNVSELKARLANQDRQKYPASAAEAEYKNQLDVLKSTRAKWEDVAGLHSQRVKQFQKELDSLDKQSSTYDADASRLKSDIIKSQTYGKNAVDKVEDFSKQIDDFVSSKASFIEKRTEEIKQSMAASDAKNKAAAKSEKTIASGAGAQNTSVKGGTAPATTTSQSTTANGETKRDGIPVRKRSQTSEQNQTSANGVNNPQKLANDYLTKLYNLQSSEQRYGKTSTGEALNDLKAPLEKIARGEATFTPELRKVLDNVLSSGRAGLAEGRSASITPRQAYDLLNDFAMMKNKNGRFYSENQAEFDKYLNGISPEMSPEKYQEALTAFSRLNAEMNRFNKSGRSFLTGLKEQFTTYLKYAIVAEIFMKIRQVMQEMVQAVKEVDAAMTELKKVTDLNEAGYVNALERAKTTAKEVGATVSDTVNATADFARLGYGVEDASELARVALIYKNVGDGIEDVSQASESIISTMKAFNIEADDAISIVDKFNEVGNNYAISSTGIGEALKRSASALAASGNTIDESIALVTAANNVVQNPESVGTAMKTYTMYLRAAKTEAEEAGEETDGMASSVSKLRDELLTLTKNRVDIMKDATTFKSTYQVTKELSEIWDSVADVDRAAILEKIGGKRNSNILSSLITNFSEAEKALDTSLHSEGSAMQENEKYLDSIAGKTAKLKAEFEDFSTSFLSSDLFSGAIAGATGFVNALDFVIDKIGGLATVIAGVGIAKFIGSISASVKALGGLSAAIAMLRSGNLGQIQAGGTIFAGLSKSFSPTALGIGAVAAAIGVVVTAINNYKSKIAEQNAETAKAAEEYKKTADSLDEYKNRIVEIRKEYDDLMKNSTLSETMSADAQQKRRELVKIEGQLVEMFGKEAGSIDLINGALDTQIDKIDQLNSESFESFKNKNRKEINRAKDYLTDLTGLSVGQLAFGDFANLFEGIGSNGSQTLGIHAIGALPGSDFEKKVFSEFEKRYGKKIRGHKGLSNQSHAPYEIDVENAYEMRDYLSGLIDIMDELGEAQFGTKYNDTFRSTIESYSKDLATVEGVIDEYEGTLNQYARGELSTNEKYKSQWAELLTARKEYDEAVISGDESQIQSAFNKIEEIRTAFEDLNIDDKAVSSYLDNYFKDFEEQEIDIYAKVNITADMENSGSQIKKAVNNIKKYFQDENGNTDIDLIKKAETDYLTGDWAETEDEAVKAYLRIAAAARNYKLEVEQLISYLVKLGYIQGSALDTAYSKAQKNISEITKSLHKTFTSIGKKSIASMRDGMEDVTSNYTDVLSDYAQIVSEVEAKNIDLSRTVFGNIDTNNRQVLEWTDENIKKFSGALKSYGENLEDIKGTVSTVYARVGGYEGFDVAYSPLLQTKDGPVLLSQQQVDDYIFELVNKVAGDGEWLTIGDFGRNEELFKKRLLKLDAKGIEKDGRKIKGIIADVGKTAERTSEVMHYLGESGAFNLSYQEVEKLAKQAGLTVDEFVKFNKAENDLNRLKLAFYEFAEAAGFTSDDFKEISSNMGEFVSLVSGAYSSFEEQAKSVAAATETITAAMTEQQEAGSISMETYEKLTELGADYSNILEWNGVGLVVNRDAVIEMNDSLRDYTAAEAEAVQAAAIDVWKKSISVIGQKSAAYSELTDKEKESLDTMIQLNAELTDQITGFQMLMSQLDYANSGYKKWLDSKNATDTDKMYSDALEAYQATQEVFGYTDKKTGKWVKGTRKVNSLAFNAATEFLVPEDVRSGGDIDAIQKYLNGIKKYMKDDQSSVKAFLKDAKKAGLMKEEGGVWSVLDGITSDDFIKRLNITKDLFLSLVGNSNVYGVTFDFDDENQILALNDAQDYFEALNEYNKASEALSEERKNSVLSLEENGEFSVSNAKEIEEAEKAVQEANDKRKNKLKELGEYSDETLKKLGVEFKKDKTREESIEEWLGGIDQKLRVNVELNTMVGKGDTQKKIQEYREAMQALANDPNNEEAINTVQELGDYLGDLPETVKVSLGIDTSLFEYGIASVSETINDLFNAHQEYELLVSTGASQEEIDEAKSEVDKLTESLNKVPPKVLAKFGLTAEKGLLNDDYTINTDNLFKGLEDGTLKIEDFKIAIDDNSDLDGTLTKLQTIQDKINEIKNMGDFVVVADLFLDEAIAKVGDMLLELNKISDAKPTATVLLSAPNVIADLMSISSILDSITESEYNAVVTATVLQAALALGGIIGQLKIIEKNHPLTVSANTSTAVTEISYVKTALDKLKDKTVTVTVNTVNSGTGGTGKVNGSAFAGGQWGVKHGGISLVGELGRELIVDPNDGTWHTVGDYGAEFAAIPQGAIVFNHKQTEALLKYGKVAGRGKALASGTAMITGGGKLWEPKYSGSGSTKSSSSSSSSKSEKDLEDLIEIFFDRLERRIDKLDKIMSSTFRDIDSRSEAAYDKIELLTQKLADKQRAADVYKAAADAVELSADVKKALRDGDFRIADLIGNITDEDARSAAKDKISKYKEYYEKYLSSNDDIIDIKNSIAEAYQGRFDAIQTDFDNQISLLDHESNTYTTALEQLEKSGYKAETGYYDALKGIEQNRYDLLAKKYDTLKSEYDAAMASGEIDYGSEAWYDLITAINETEEAMQEVNSSMIEYTNKARELIWDVFDARQDKIGVLIDQNEFLMDLIDESNLFDKDGKITQKGVSYVAVGLDSLRKYLKLAKNYGGELEKIREQLLLDPNNEILQKREKELNENQQQAILSAKKSAQAINDVELTSLKNLIESYEDALSKQKDMRDYQRKLRDKTEDISNIRKQIEVYSNDTSEEAKRKVQELQKKLRDSEEDLEDTQYDRYVSMQKEMFDDLYKEYEEAMNRRFDDVNGMMADVTAGLESRADDISDTLKTIAQGVGYIIQYELDRDQFGDINLDGLISPEDARLAMRASVGLEKLTEEQAARGDVNGNGVVDAGDARALLRVATKIDTIDQYLRALGIVGYSGGGLVSKTGLAMLHGTASDPEVVLDAADSKNLMGLRDTMREMTRLDLFPFGVSEKAMIHNGISSPSIGEIQINIPIDRVEDYNDFINKMKSDDRFGKLIRAASVDLLNGGSAMKVYQI